jgi:hypothetical protein
MTVKTKVVQQMAPVVERTEEELAANYAKFLKVINKYFTGDRLDKLLFMYSEEQLGENLAIAPASGNLGYHNCYVGGYIDHIFNVCSNAFKMRDLFQSVGGTIDFTEEEMIFSALHHDLGKLGEAGKPNYIPNDSAWHIENQGKLFTNNPKLDNMTTTDRTFFTLQHYGLTYSIKEYFAIRLTDGMYDEDNQKYLKVFDPKKAVRCKLPFVLHWADHMSTVVESQQNTY